MNRSICLFVFLATPFVLAQSLKVEGVNLEPHVEDVLRELATQTGAHRILVREKERTAVDQARVMFKLLVLHEKAGRDAKEILLRQFGPQSESALNAYSQYKSQGKDLTIEYMAFHIEEEVKKLRQLDSSNPNSRAFVYVLPLPYHLVELDLGGFPSLASLKSAMKANQHILFDQSIEPEKGVGRSCKNCYLLAIRKP